MFQFSEPSSCQFVKRSTLGECVNCGIQYCLQVILTWKMSKWPVNSIGSHSASIGNLWHACQAWHVERFSMARWVNWNTVIMIS